MPTCPTCSAELPEDSNVCARCVATTIDYEEPLPKPRSILRSISEVIVVVGTIVVGFLVFVGLPHFDAGVTAARYSQCQNNLKRIGLALKAYCDEYGRLPPAYVTDAYGQRLHSWRVLILPYLDERPLYDEIDLGEPWCSPKNSRLQARMPDIFRCPASPHRGPGFTHYRAVVGDDCWMTATGKRSLGEVEEPMAASLLVGECRSAVNWMEPRDVSFDDMKSWDDEDCFLGPHEANGGGMLLFADGTVSKFRATVAKLSIENFKDECSISRSRRVIGN